MGGAGPALWPLLLLLFISSVKPSSLSCICTARRHGHASRLLKIGRIKRCKTGSSSACWRDESVGSALLYLILLIIY